MFVGQRLAKQISADSSSFIPHPAPVPPSLAFTCAFSTGRTAPQGLANSYCHRLSAHPADPRRNQIVFSPSAVRAAVQRRDKPCLAPWHDARSPMPPCTLDAGDAALPRSTRMSQRERGAQSGESRRRSQVDVGRSAMRATGQFHAVMANGAPNLLLILVDRDSGGERRGPLREPNQKD